MNDKLYSNWKIEAAGWSAIFIWWGVVELSKFLPNGTGAIGIGLILIGINVARKHYGIPGSRFTTTLGILTLVWGGLDLANALLRLPFELPIFAILLIVLGVIVLVPVLNEKRNQLQEG